MPNHWNDADKLSDKLSDKLITRVLLYSIVAEMLFPTLILKMSCIFRPKPIQLNKDAKENRYI